MSARDLVTEHLDLWTGAVRKKSRSGRGRNGKVELTGIKKLRELILQLAVAGRLVEQNLQDEPAATLVSKMLQNRDHLASTEDMRTKASESVSYNDEYICIPSSWSWISLGNMAKFIDYRGKTPTKISTGKRLITAKNIRQGRIDLQPEEFISEADYTNWMTRGFPRKGDLLFTPEAPLGNAAIVDLDEKFALAQRVICFQWHIPETSEFMLLQILASPFQDQLMKNATGMTATGIKASKLKEIPVAIPPLEEQHRIVQKVDELMALCDRLEQQTSDQLEAHETLVGTLLGTLTQSENVTELADNWARLAAHFDTLFTTEQSIDKLKQTILQLAVMGRLVEQDAGDEPAPEALRRIQAGKEQLSQLSKQRKAKPLPPISESEEPFSLPSGWALSRLDDITDIQGGIAKGKKVTGKKTRTLPYLRVANVQRSSLNLSEIKEIEIAEDEVERYLVCERDLLITEGGDWDKVGRTAIWDGHIEPMAHQNHVFRARLILQEQNERWLERYLNSQFARDYFASSSKQTTNLASINKTQLRSCIVPLPSLEEQHRIVQKVDELMALCDQLKERLKQASETRCHMAEAVVEGALSE